MPRQDADKICDSEVKKLINIGLACCGKQHSCCMTRQGKMVEGQRIECYVNHLILQNNYDIVFAGKIPLVDNKQYQVCTWANDLLIEYEKEKAEEEEKENGGNVEENNPC